MLIQKAVRKQRKARIDITGPSGSGKTKTSLLLASGLGGRILVIDSERSSSSLYADDVEFDVLELPNLSLGSYFSALELAAKSDYDVVIIDSLSHAWEGINEAVNEAAKRERGGNTFQLWGKVGNPLYAKLLEAILQLPAHVIVTMRVKSDYVMEEYTGSDGKTRTKPVKVGLAPKFREGGEYEFDLVANLDIEHNLIIEKTRLPFLDGRVFNKPGKELGAEIGKWLAGGAIVTKPVPIYPVDNNTGGVRPAVTEIPVYPGNPWAHVVQGENSQQGVALCMIEDETWFPKAANQKVPKKSFTAMDIAAVQKILNADNEYNQAQRQEAKDWLSEPHREIEA